MITLWQAEHPDIADLTFTPSILLILCGRHRLGPPAFLAEIRLKIQFIVSFFYIALIHIGFRCCLLRKMRVGR